MPGSAPISSLSYLPVSCFTPFLLTPFFSLSRLLHGYDTYFIHLRLHIYISSYVQTTLSRYHHTRLRVSPIYTFTYLSTIYLLLFLTVSYLQIGVSS